jgi:hypothetical protein
MKARTIAIAVLLCLAGAAVCFASDVYMGTWKLNEAKSKLSSSGGKNNTVTYEAAGDSVKVTIDGVSADGKPLHDEWTGKIDGQDYPVTGDPTSDTRSYKKVNDHTMAFTAKKDGKTVITGRIVVAADGKTRTVTSSSTDSSGKKTSSTAVYDKE